MDPQAKRAALFLLLATGPLVEVLSENVQLLTYLQPLPFFLVTVTYGVPVLLIRELAVARDLNTLGVALLGLAYGVLNEGVLAKTLLFGLGDGLIFALFSSLLCVVSGRSPLQAVAAGAIFLVLIRAVLRKPLGRVASKDALTAGPR